MKNNLPLLVIVLLSFCCIPLLPAQQPDSFTRSLDSFVSTATDFDFMLDPCLCQSKRRNPDGSWNEERTTRWYAKRILDGTGIQDFSETVDSATTLAATSIRQYDEQSKHWKVSFFSKTGVAAAPSTWTGGRQSDGKVLLTLSQKAPNGMEGYSVLQFYDISEAGYKWKGEWIDTSGTIVYPFWTIDCKRE